MSHTGTGLAKCYDALLLDLDGVLYIGEDPVPHAAESLAACAQHYDAKRAYITNNASRTPEQVVAVLDGVGVSASVNEVVTSAQVAAEHLASTLPQDSRVLVVGGEGLDKALVAEGLVPVRSLEEEPVAVVQGFHRDVGWRDLALASVAVARGIPWVASNTDMTIPTPLGIAPGNGTLVAAVATASGKAPVVVGKPQRPAIDSAIKRLGSTRPLIVGDRLDTDIEAANRVGIPSLLVMTGVTDVKTVCCAPPHQRPTFIGMDLRTLLEPYESPTTSSNLVELGKWRFAVSDGGVELVDRGELAINGLRALASACWMSAVEGVVEENVVAEAVDVVQRSITAALADRSQKA